MSYEQARLLKAMDLEDIALEAGVTVEELPDPVVRRRMLDVLQAKRGSRRRLDASEQTWELVTRMLSDRLHRPTHH